MKIDTILCDTLFPPFKILLLQKDCYHSSNLVVCPVLRAISPSFSHIRTANKISFRPSKKRSPNLTGSGEFYDEMRDDFLLLMMSRPENGLIFEQRQKKKKPHQTRIRERKTEKVLAIMNVNRRKDDIPKNKKKGK